MGFLDLFRKDAGAELDKAERWLDAGDRVGALDLARRHIQDKDPALRERAQTLADRSRQELIDANLAKAETSEAAGDPADAADWVGAALHHVTDEAHRQELADRQAELERQAELSGREPDWDAAVRRTQEDLAEEEGDEEADDEPAAEPTDPVVTRVAETDPGEAEIDPVEAEIRFDLLTDTLRDDIAERYAERGDDFRLAYLAINDAEPERALPVLDALVERDGDDPVLRFERGRCRLLLGDAAGAQADLELAWKGLGDEPLDRAESLRLPTLWGEASLEAGDPEAVIDRLADLARPESGDGELSALYGHALVRVGDLDDARRFLARAYEAFPKRQDLPLALGQVLAVLGERQLAIDLLERAVAPSCAGGSCSRPPLHLPSLRALVALHLGMTPRPVGVAADLALGDDAAFTPSRKNLDRVDDLMRWIAGAQGGQLAAPDHLLAARYHELTGDAERAEAARFRASQAATETTPDLAAAPADLAGATGKAAL